jgi:hypothetical protein
LGVAENFAISQIDPADAEVGVLGEQAGDSRLELEAEREAVALEQLDRAGHATPSRQYALHCIVTPLVSKAAVR